MIQLMLEHSYRFLLVGMLVAAVFFIHTKEKHNEKA